MIVDLDRNLGEDFVSYLSFLKSEYGSKLTKLNGVAQSNLNFTDFIDGFTSDNKVVDISINPNANSDTKDVTSLMHTMAEPHQKLLAMNKIFYEITKKYGLEQAKKWLKGEWTGETYLHDFPTSTLTPYCIYPTECCLFINDGKYVHCSVEDMYNIIDSEEYVGVDGVSFKKPSNLMVLDYNTDSGNSRFTRVTVITKKVSDEDIYYTKMCNGRNVLTTKSHKFITTDGDTDAYQLIPRKSIAYTTFDDRQFTNSIHTYNGLDLNFNNGYLVGMYLAEGYNQRGQLSICQDKEKSPDTFDKITQILDGLGESYKLYKNNSVIRLSNRVSNIERKILSICKGKYCTEKRLCVDYTHFNEEFLKGILSGIIDGDECVAQNSQLMIRMTSRTLINQIHNIGMHFGVYFSGRLPYIQSQEGKIRQKCPIYSANINMNRNKDFFLNLGSLKINKLFTDFLYDEKMARNNYTSELGKIDVMDVCQTYKSTPFVYDLSTESHTFVCNDILVHNCYAVDLDALVEKGLFFTNKFKTSPAKHLTTFNDHCLEFIGWLSNRQSGAVGLPSYLVYSWWFWRNDVDNGYFLKDKEYYRRQSFQKFIYDCNQPYLRVVQSAFTNITIMDRNYLEELFGVEFSQMVNLLLTILTRLSNIKKCL